MSRIKVVLATVSLIAFASTSAAQSCGTVVIDDEPKVVVLPVTDTNWQVCLLHRQGTDDGKASVRLTIRESVPVGDTNTNDFRVSVIMHENTIEPNQEECSVYGVKANEELAIVRTAGVPAVKIVRICSA